MIESWELGVVVRQEYFEDKSHRPQKIEHAEEVVSPTVSNGVFSGHFGLFLPTLGHGKLNRENLIRPQDKRLRINRIVPEWSTKSRYRIKVRYPPLETVSQ